MTGRGKITWPDTCLDYPLKQVLYRAEQVKRGTRKFKLHIHERKISTVGRNTKAAESRALTEFS